MSKSIVILSGSPRKRATTDRLVQAFTEGAESAGAGVRCFRVADMKIGGCLGCGHCFEEQGVCVQKDDMRSILDALRGADAITFASPVYYFGFTAQLKLAIDRTYALLKEGMPIKRAALLMTCGASSAEAAASSISMFRQISALQKWEEAGIVIVPGLHKPGEIEGRGELEKARELGKCL
ncbi:MAG: flavodoxin family protein [Clostridiales bacterium]|jgi:multimeric flavodoxin WrbA|nr:flavodoxin family protein [Clostridiales bacterium]